MATPSLLLAGFRPHEGVPDDAARSVLAPLLAEWDHDDRDLVLHTLELPWSHARAGRAVEERLLEVRPVFFVLVDVDPTSPDHVLQVFAANWVDDPLPDDDGAVLRDTIVDQAGPVAYRSKLPLDGIWDKFLVERVPCRMGHKAGWSVFNHVYYRAMRTIETSGLGTRGGAVHLPTSVADVEGRRDEERRREDVDMMLMTMRRLYGKVERDEAREAEHGRSA